MTGHDGGQQPADPRPSPDDPGSAVEAGPAAPEAAKAEPAPPEPVEAGSQAHPSTEAGPAPQQRPAPAHEPAPAGPFGGASPALGSAWLGSPGTLTGPSGIEPTTGAPLAMLPQRAPRGTVPVWDGPTGSVPTAQPGTDPDAGEDADDFWLPIEEVHWDGTPVRPTPRTWYGRPKDPSVPATRHRRAKPPKPQRNPALGLAGVILLSLVASFFAWVSAEPLWLAIGHGDAGTATVTTCTGRGLGQHCRGEFITASGRFIARDVQLVGVDGDRRDVGTRLGARMTGADSTKAYVGAGTGLLHLRWSLGLGVVLLCSAGASWITGARRLSERRSRRNAALVSLAGPLLLSAGFLVAAY